MSLYIDSTFLHPSTRLALEATSWLENIITPRNVLEIGCGNGILSLTSAYIWDAEVLACDISAQAVADTSKNIENEGMKEQITVIRADGFKHQLIAERGPYDLILANLLAEWQVQMAKNIKINLSEHGVILLSGVLAWQAEGIKEAFSSINIDIIQTFAEKEWNCYVGCHTSYKASFGL